MLPHACVVVTAAADLTVPSFQCEGYRLACLQGGTYQISKFCMEPTSFRVKEESEFKNKEAEFVKTKLMTRLTYTLDEVSWFTALSQILWGLGRGSATARLR